MKTIYIIFIYLISNILIAQTNIFDVSRSGSVEEITQLYKNDKAIINKKNNDGYTPLVLACYHGNTKVAAFLIDKSENVDGSSKYGTPLMAAVVKEQIEIIKLLLKKKADTNISDSNGTTALHYATLFQKPNIVKLLIEAGANCNIKDQHGKSPLDYAKMNKYTEIINLFKKILP